MLVYLITNLVNGKRYAGQTTQRLSQRWSAHQRFKPKGKSHIYFAIQKYGVQNFEIEPLIIVHRREDLDFYETFLIKEFDLTNPSKGYNLSLGGKGSSGYKHTEEALRKISEASKLSNRGKIISAETRKRISISLLGRAPSFRAIQQAAEVNTGKKRSEETKRKISLSKMGNKSRLGMTHSEETKRKMSESYNRRKLCANTVLPEAT